MQKIQKNTQNTLPPFPHYKDILANTFYLEVFRTSWNVILVTKENANKRGDNAPVFYFLVLLKYTDILHATHVYFLFLNHQAGKLHFITHSKWCTKSSPIKL